MPFFKSKKKSLKDKRDLSPIARLILPSTNIAKAVSNENAASESNSLQRDSQTKIRTDSDLTRISSNEPAQFEEATKKLQDDGLAVRPSKNYRLVAEKRQKRGRNSSESNSRSVSFNSDTEDNEHKFQQIEVDQQTKNYISSLHNEISSLKEENMKLLTEHQCSVEKYMDQINALNEQNTELKTRLNSRSSFNEREVKVHEDRKQRSVQASSGSGLGRGSTLSPDQNLYETPSKMNADDANEKLENITRMLQAQIEEFSERYFVKPTELDGSKKTPNKFKKHQPNWVINFEDMGPLVEAYDIKLKQAHEIIKNYKKDGESNQDLLEQKEMEIQNLQEERDTLQDHLANLSTKMTQQQKSFQTEINSQHDTMIKKSEHRDIINDTKEQLEYEMNQKLKILETENDTEITEITENFKREKINMQNSLEQTKKEKGILLKQVEEQRFANEKLAADNAANEIKIDVATKTNAKYIVSLDSLMEKCESLAKDLAVTRAKEQEWKLHTKKSTDLLEKALEERDIYHLLAAREHENCRHAINSASGLKLQHLKELHNLFQNNISSGKLLNYHSGKLGSINSEIGLIRNALSVRVEEIEKIKSSRGSEKNLSARIDEIAETIKSENLKIDGLLNSNAEDEGVISRDSQSMGSESSESGSSVGVSEKLEKGALVA